MTEVTEIKVIKLPQYFKKSTNTALQQGSEQASNPTEKEDIKGVKKNLTDMTGGLMSCFGLVELTGMRNFIYGSPGFQSITLKEKREEKLCYGK